MKQLIVISLIALLISAVLPKPPAETQSELRLIWKAPIGLTTYRTQALSSAGSLFIGSNGLHLRDYALDLKSGVYKIDLKSGKVKTTFANERLGDMDVNGIVEVNNNLIFGNDNDELLCYEKSGKFLWRTPILGDVESSPIPVKIGGKSAVIVSTEAGHLAAFDVTSGRKIWSRVTIDNNKAYEEEISAFAKVDMYFYEEGHLLMNPIVAELDGDGTSDLIIVDYGGMQAYAGATGKPIWEKKFNEIGWPTTIRSQQYVAGTGRNLRLCIPMSHEVDGKYRTSLYYFDRTGKELDKLDWNTDGSTTLTHPNNMIVTTSALIFPGKSAAEYKEVPIVNSKAATWSGNRFSEGQCAADLIEYNNEACVLACFQSDSEHENKSVLVLIGTQTGIIHLCHVLPDFSEFTPIPGDANRDGNLDVLINCADQQLYCYDLKIKTNALLKSK